MELLKSLAGEWWARPGRDTAAWLRLLDDGNGYEREAAVEALGRLRHGPAVPALLVRVNDWVPQVRKAAGKAILALLDDEFLQDWIGALDSVVRLERARRADHAALLASISDFLGKPRNLPAVVAATADAHALVKRHVLRLQWRHTTVESGRFALVRQALAGTDVVNACWALGQLAQFESTEDRRALVAAACAARFAPVRAAGLRSALRDPVAVSSDLLQAMCLDDSAVVREMALEALKLRGEVGPVLLLAINRVHDSQCAGRVRATALKFVCSADPEGALGLCEAASRASSAVLRRAALSFLLSAAPEGEREALMLRALSDPSSPVQRLTVEMVRRGAAVPPEGEVLQILLSHGAAGSLARAFAILSHSPAWTRLHWLLRASSGVLPSGGADACRKALAQWEVDARNNFVPPSVLQRRELSAQWRAVQPTVPSPLRGLLAHHLQANGIETGKSDD